MLYIYFISIEGYLKKRLSKIKNTMYVHTLPMVTES